MSACCCSLAGTAACQTCSQNPYAVMSKMMTPQPSALRDIMVNLQTENPQTNADRIRAMTDEELAHFMTPENYKFPCPPNHIDCQYELIPCWMCWERWLKAPVEMGGEAT